MLSELHVHQFALIEDVQLELGDGMTVFSGETGAGKSMLVDALGAAFGARASSDWVRHGAERAEVVAVLGAVDDSLVDMLSDNDLDAGDELVLRRVIRSDGSSRAYVNGSPVPARLMQDIGRVVLDMHGQHEHQSLLRPEFQRELVDAGISGTLKDKVGKAWRDWQQQRDRLARLLDQRQQGVREEAWMREEMARLDALGLEDGGEPGLTVTLQQQVDAGRHYAQISEAAAQALAVVEDNEDNVRSRLGGCTHQLESVAEFRPEIRAALDLLAEVDALLGEAAPALRAVLDSEFDADSLQQTETRLMDLHEAMRRNQTDEAGLSALQAGLREKLEMLDTGGWDEDAQRQCLEAARASFLKLAGELSESRRKAGKSLIKTLRPFLDKLALGGMQLEVVVQEQAQDEAMWAAHGADSVVFMAASNPGEPFRELASVASGGELSRLVLALKGCGAMTRAPQTAVFDEVDTGIGGETAWCVGELLAEMGGVHQVLVISHLPQVAACAGRQVHIFKEQRNGRTISDLKALDGSARLEEMARMLGGVDVKSREHAAQMLARGAALAAAA